MYCSNTTPASIYIVSTNDGLKQRIVTPQEMSVPLRRFFPVCRGVPGPPSTVSCLQTLMISKAGRLFSQASSANLTAPVVAIVWPDAMETAQMLPQATNEDMCHNVVYSGTVLYTDACV